MSNTPNQSPAEAHGPSDEIKTRITNLMLYADKLRDASAAETEEEGWANRLLHGLEALHAALSKAQPKAAEGDAPQWRKTAEALFAFLECVKDVGCTTRYEDGSETPNKRLMNRLHAELGDLLYGKPNVQPKGMRAELTDEQIDELPLPRDPDYAEKLAFARAVIAADRALQAPAPGAGVTMADAVAAGDGTLHGAIDYWQRRALKAEAGAAAPVPADRERFEAYLRHETRWPSIPATFERLPDGAYADRDTQRHWWTWQQARAAQAPAVEAEMTDEQIDELMPEADGCAEVNKVRCEVLPGVPGYEFDTAAAWSAPLVRQTVRAALAASKPPVQGSQS